MLCGTGAETLLESRGRARKATRGDRAAGRSKCSELCRHKDEKLGHKGADGAVAMEVHPDGQEQVPGLGDRLGEGHHPTVGAHLPSGEKALLIAAGNGQLHAVPRDGIGGAHAENHRGHLDVGGEREVVVGYSQRQLGALLVLMARQALAAAARQVGRERRVRARSASREQQRAGRGLAGRGLPPPPGPCGQCQEHPHSPGGGVGTSGLLTQAPASSTTLRGRWWLGSRAMPRLKCVPVSQQSPSVGALRRHPLTSCLPGSWPLAQTVAKATQCSQVGLR